MIVHVTVPLLRHSLEPQKIAEHMNLMLDPDHDHVQSVAVTEESSGRVEVWSSTGEAEVFNAEVAR